MTRRPTSLSAAALCLLIATSVTGCSTLGRLARGAPSGSSPEAELRAGAEALERDDLSMARTHLAPLADSCLDEGPARRAALLLATAELDPTLTAGSPTHAALLSARVLAVTPASDPDAIQARSLYRMAADRGGEAPVPLEASRCTEAGVTPLPLGALPSPTTAGRIEALTDSLARRTDALVRERTRAEESEARVLALEAELERIRQLLRSGTGPNP